MGFTINIAKGLKKKTDSDKPNKISRLCIGTTIKEDNEYKIKVNLLNDPLNPDYMILPFTEKSLSLVGKEKVFKHYKDKYGHYICCIREKKDAIQHPGLPIQYTAVVEGEVCSGYIIRIKGNFYFDMISVHGRGTEVRDLPSKLDNTKPLFSK